MTETADPTVLAVVASPRSGTTVLGSVLGELDGWVHVGELRDLWAPGVRRSRQLCGCGLPADECPHWRAVAARVGGSAASATRPGLSAPETPTAARVSVAAALGLPDAEAVADAQRRLTLGRACAGPDGPAADAARRYAAAQARLYRAVAAETGARVVVDTSKSLPETVAVARHAGLAVRVLHLVRDPRGVLFSRQRRLAPRRQDGTVVLDPRTTAVDGLRWLRDDLVAAPVAAAWSVPVRRLDYNDLLADPQAVIRAIATGIGHPPDGLPFDGLRTVEVGVHHTISGNVNRFWAGSVALLPDELWREMLSPRDKAVLAAGAAPGRLERWLRR